MVESHLPPASGPDTNHPANDPMLMDLTAGPEPVRLFYSPKWLAMCFVLIFAGIVGLTYYLQTLQSRTSTNSQLITTFTGTGDGDTDFFTVEDSWEIRWKHQGHLKIIEWLGANDTGDMLIEMHKKPIREQGQIYVGKGGTFQLKIVGEGPWTMQVWQFTQ
jgi:hypothetical protein